MMSTVVIMMLIVTITTIPGEAANLRLNKNLEAGGFKFLTVDKTIFDGPPTMTTAESIQGDPSYIREQRHALYNMIGGDGGRGSVMFLTNSDSRSNGDGRTSGEETNKVYPNELHSRTF